jgi:uncharacterized phosphosugar-binding protein
VRIAADLLHRIVGEGGVHQFVFLERVEGYGVQIMKGYNFDPRDTMWIFSHSGINNVNIDVALEAKRLGMRVIAYGSAAAAKGKQTRHSSGKTIFDCRPVVEPAPRLATPACRSRTTGTKSAPSPRWPSSPASG